MTDSARAEISAAIAIVKEDRIYKAVHEGRTPAIPELIKTPENTPPKDGEPVPPPVKEETVPPKRKGIWWGDRIEDDTPAPVKVEEPAK